MSTLAGRPTGLLLQKQHIDTFARCLAALCVIAVIFATFRLFNGADTPFLAFSVIGAVAAHLSTRPRLWEMVITVALAAALAIAYARSGGVFGVYPAAGAVAAAAFLGLGSILILGFKAARSTEALRPLLIGVCYPALAIFTSMALAAIIRFQPQIFDLFLYRFDALLGMQFSFVAGRWFTGWHLLRNVCFLVYSGLPLAQVLVFVLFLRGQRMDTNPLVVCIASGVAGFLFYQVCPATGPIHIFGAEFPQYPPDHLPLETMRLYDVPRNAVPSLHSAWALLLWWNVRYARIWIRQLALWFLVFTLLATLGMGEHYLVDLVVAVPFAVSIQTACMRQWAKALGSGALTLAWLLYLRFGLPVLPPSGIQAWIAVVATLAGSACFVMATSHRNARRRTITGIGDTVAPAYGHAQKPSHT